jgi:ketosteroid isomerase-like protein
VEIVREIFEAAARRDSKKVLALYSPDVVMDGSHTEMARFLGREVWRGYEGLRSFEREWRETFESIETDYDELIDAGDRVVSVSRWRVRGRDGIEVSAPARGGLWTIHDGKVVRIDWFDTPEKALQAAGLLG